MVPRPLAMESQSELAAAEVSEWQSERRMWWKCSVIVVWAESVRTQVLPDTEQNSLFNI